MSQNKKPPTSAKGSGSIKTFAGQQIGFSVFDSSTTREQKTIPSCYECGKRENAGFRFRLVPVCGCCRTEREVEITRNRFERRQNNRRAS